MYSYLLTFVKNSAILYGVRAIPPLLTKWMAKMDYTTANTTIDLLLLRRDRNNPLLVGKHGTGKTEYAQAKAKKKEENRIYIELKEFENMIYFKK